MNSALINGRLDRLPATRTLWKLVLILSLGAWFEYFDMLFTAYIGPNLVKTGMFTATSASFFGFSGLGCFVAATFGGMLVGTALLGSWADKYGRKFVFTIALLIYSIATGLMAFQHDSTSISIFRFIAGIGIGLELVTINTYVAELVPAKYRGQAFCLVETIAFTAVPVVALLAWGTNTVTTVDPWRVVSLIGVLGAFAVWFIRLGLPESPRWLAAKGRIDEADAIVTRMEINAQKDLGVFDLPPIVESPALLVGSWKELFEKPYRARMVMLSVFNFCQTVGYYGFASWLPTLLISKGISVTTSLGYAVVIALANPVGPILADLIADKIERKWLIVGSALGVAVSGLWFGVAQQPARLMLAGVLVVLFSNIMVCGFRAYQAELFPTRLRSRAIGIVFSFSRISAVLCGFMIAYCLHHFGINGVFALITSAMVVVMGSIGIFGPKTTGLTLNEISR